MGIMQLARILRGRTGQGDQCCGLKSRTGGWFRQAKGHFWAGIWRIAVFVMSCHLSSVVFVSGKQVTIEVNSFKCFQIRARACGNSQDFGRHCRGMHLSVDACGS